MIDVKVNGVDSDTITQGNDFVVTVTFSTGSWDGFGVGSPSVIVDGSTYHMWYDANDGTTPRIGHATSSDGVAWTEDAGNPVLDLGTSGSWEDEAVNQPSVFFDGATYHMWYSGEDGSTGRIGYATSSDGVTWTKYAANPVLDVGTPGAWDSLWVAAPIVVFDGSSYHMWYVGFGGNNGIGYATSDDGIIWTRYAGNPVLERGTSGDFDDGFLWSPEVVFDGTTYHMWYTGIDGGHWAVGYASSTDGVTWTKHTDDTNGQQTWNPQESGTTSGLSSVYFVDDMTGWAAGAGGTILHTTNGGTDWVAQSSGAGTTIDLSITFVDASTGYAVGSGGIILKTTDGGSTWIEQSSGSSENLGAVSFVDASTGWVVGWNGTILKTTDGGSNWSAQSSGTSSKLYSVHFVNSTTGWATGDGGIILKTTDGGSTWIQQSQPSGVYSLFGVYFVNSSMGWAVSVGGKIISTTDGGSNWSIQSTGHPILWSVHFVNSTTGWVVGDGGTILKTTDGGEQWTSQLSGTDRSLRSVFFTDSQTGTAVGDQGTILRATTVFSVSPVLDVGAPGTWDEEGVGFMFVLLSESTYHMWYTGWDSDTYTGHLGYATSTDGVTWTRHTDNPVLDPGTRSSREADLTVWIDMDDDGVLDESIDIQIDEPDHIVDNSPFDEDPTEGIYQFTVSDEDEGDINRVGNMGLFFKAEDTGGSDDAFLFLEPMVSNYSVSGTISPAVENIVVAAIRPMADDEDVWYTLTDETGGYQVFLPEAGVYSIITADFLGATGGMFPDRGYYNVYVDGHLTGYDFTYIAATAWIEGTVTDENSNPLHGIEVFARIEEGQDLQSWIETDESGYYTLGLLEGDWEVGLDGADLIPGYMVPEGEEFHMSEGATRTVNFTAYSTDATITGTVFLDDAPAGGVQARAWSPLGSTRTVSTAHGFYTLSVASEADGEGGYDVGVAEWRLPFPAYVDEYYSGIMSGSAGIDFHVYEIPFGAIEGIVTDETTGDPIEGVRIDFWRFDYWDVYRTRTDENGSYHQDLPVGDYRIEVFAFWLGYINEVYNNQSHPEEANPVSVGEDQTSEINFDLGLGGEISGTVTDPEGRPIPGVGVTVLDWDEIGGWRWFHSGTGTDGDGNYTARGIPTGDQLVYSEARGFFTEYHDGVYDQESASPVYITAPSTTSGIDFVLEQDGSLYPQRAGNLHLAVGNDARLGNDGVVYFPSAEWPEESGNNYLYSGGLWIGAELDDYRSVSTAFYGTEWSPADGFHVEHIYSDEDVYVEYHDMDYGRNPSPLGLEVRQASYAWEGEDYLIFRYKIRNTDYRGELRNIMVGLFFDFDIATHAGDDFWRDDRVGFEDDLGISYMYDNDGDDGASPGYVGVHPLDQPVHSHSWWGWATGDPGDDWDQYEFMTRGFMGDPGYDDDFRILQSVGPFFLAPGSEMELSFALAIGEGLDSLKGATEKAQERFDEVLAMARPPGLASVKDVPKDQGRQVRLIWGSGSAGPDETFTRYSIWRHVDDEPGDLWDFLTNVPYIGFGDYAYVAPTLVDSNMYTGPEDAFWSTFRVIAHTEDRHFFLVSEPMRGYSLDNLEPTVPGGLIATGGLEGISLSWEPNPEEDLDYYSIYRGTTSGFEPDEPYTHTVDTLFVDEEVGEGITYFYVITATDFNGNESGYSDEVGGILGIDEGARIPERFELAQNYPNPFNPVTTLRYGLPERSHVTLVIYDLLGRRVRTLVSRIEDPGYKSVLWNGTDGLGRSVSAGVYIYRIQAGDPWAGSPLSQGSAGQAGREFTQTRKMVLLK
ncbi:MAG: carboxypeptidase regulatory-like domain-containing protein [Fidelibacterota bacterium]